MIADSCGSREIKVDILELLAKAKETSAFFSFYPPPPTFLEEHMRGLRNGHFFKTDKNIKPSGDVINSYGSRTEDVFPCFKEQSFPLFRATPWKPLEQPWDSQP